MSKIFYNRTLKIPGDVYKALQAPENKREEIIKKELALSLYKEKLLSFGKARQLANMSKWEFHVLLAERNIEKHYTEKNLQEDIEYAKESE